MMLPFETPLEKRGKRTEEEVREMKEQNNRI